MDVGKNAREYSVERPARAHLTLLHAPGSEAECKWGAKEASLSPSEGERDQG